MTIPNIITLFRIALAPIFVYMVYLSACAGAARYRCIAIVIFLIASSTDFLDGYLARKFHKESHLGRILDVTADKLLTISAIIVLTFLNKLPLNLPYWAAAVILLRDVLVIIGIVWLYIRTKKFYVKPNIFGKAGITFEMLMVISVLFVYKYSFIFWQIAATFAVVSAIIYAFETQKAIRKV